MFEKKEKLYVYIVIFFISFAVFGLIVYIWSSLFLNSKYKEINTFDNSITYENKMTDYYSNYLQNALNIMNFEQLYMNISPEYVHSISIEEPDFDTLKYNLRDRNIIGTDISIISSTYSEYSNKQYYRFKYTNGNQTKYVNIIESQPYDFEVSFEQDDISSIIPNSNVTKAINNVEYNFVVSDSTTTSISYNLTINNNSDSIYVFDFNSLNHVQLIYNDTEYINMASIALSSTSGFELTPGSSKSITLLFNVESQNQFLISGFRFLNVTIGNENNNTILVDF